MQSQALQEMNGGPSPPFFIFIKFTVEKLPQAEAEIKDFIAYTREHKIDYSALMQM